MHKRQCTLALLIFFVTAPVLAQVHGGFYPRPTPMGTSISATPTLPYISAGTAGMRVRALWNSSFVFILSNAHVLSAVGPELCPDTATRFSTWILQPGTLDLGFDPGNDPTYFAGIYALSKPISFASGASNVVDVAIAFTTEALASREILGIGNPTAALDTATAGMAITKSGRTTGVTTGSVTSINSTINVNYGASCGGTARFVQQVVTSANLGAGGDSGSVVLNSSNLRPVGLYFAGSAFSGIANPILAVYQSFGVFVDGTGSRINSVGDLANAAAAQAADPALERLKQIQAREQDAIMAIPGIAGIGIGLDESGKSPVFVVYTVDKPAQMVSRVPRRLDGVPVRLLRGGEIIAH